METETIHRQKENLILQVKTIAGLGMVELCYFAALSCLAPFFTKEAKLKGVNITVSGIVFIASPLFLVITSCFLGTAILWFGARRVFFGGMLIVGCSNICFGFLNRIESTTVFVVLCILCRAIAGFGSVAICVKVIFLMKAFPDDINKAVGLSEAVAGAGLSLGPTIGGILYDWGGFPLPFWTVGTVVLCLIPIGAYLLPQVDSESDQSKPISASAHWQEIIKSPTMFLNIWVAFILACAWTFLDPTLEPHLRHEFGITSSTTGGIFLIMAFSYSLSCIFLGSISHHVTRMWIFVFAGLLGSGLALLSVDPSLFVYDYRHLWTKCVGLGLFGVLEGFAFVPLYSLMVDDSITRGFPQNKVTFGTLSGFRYSGYSLGEVVGPSLGSAVMQHFGFHTVCTIIAATLFVTGVLVCCYFTYAEARKSKDYAYLESTNIER